MNGEHNSGGAYTIDRGITPLNTGTNYGELAVFQIPQRNRNFGDSTH